MKQQITSEKFKKLELKKSMLNFKIFSLMKKQLFSLVILLAIIFGFSSNLFGQTQGTGLTPTSIRLVAIGSKSTFSITNDGESAVAVNWEVWDATVAEATGFSSTIATAALEDSHYNFITSLTVDTEVNPDVATLAIDANSSMTIRFFKVACSCSSVNLPLAASFSRVA